MDTESLFQIVSNNHFGAADSSLLPECEALVRKHHKLRSLLQEDGGLFSLGGSVVERPVSVFWMLAQVAHSLDFRVATAGKQLLESRDKNYGSGERSAGQNYAQSRDITWGVLLPRTLISLRDNRY